MSTLVRNIRTGEYLESLEIWTAAPERALDFGSIPRAFEVVRRRGLRDVEFVLTDGVGRVSSVPAAKIGSTYHLSELLGWSQAGATVANPPQLRPIDQSGATP